METPILTKTQQKNTLSAKKKARVTIKNVVASPYSSFWPQISNEDNVQLTEALQKHLPRIKSPKTSVPWDVLKSVPRDERKQFREDYNEIKVENKNPNNFGIVFGINDVTKCLENNKLDSVLISSDVNPRLMVSHVIDMCVLNNCNILIVDELRNTLKSICGINSVTIGFKRNSNLSSVLVEIKRIFGSHSVPEGHINYNRNEGIVSNNCKDSNKSKKCAISVDVEKIQKSVYLMRTSNDKRVFVPEETQFKNVKEKSDDFLSFGDDCNEKSKNVVKTKNYKSLIVKRLKGNPKREKKKLNLLKKK